MKSARSHPVRTPARKPAAMGDSGRASGDIPGGRGDRNDCGSCGRPLCWSAGRLVCAIRSCASYGQPMTGATRATGTPAPGAVVNATDGSSARAAPARGAQDALRGAA
jgi:hypothetical protein